MNKDRVDISFVVPAYNEEKFIEQCLASILKQAKKSNISFEIIVVNNNSTDQTKEIVSKFKEVQLIDEFQKGLTFARQAGFLKSKGKLIANLDADVILPEKWIETVIREFNKDKNLVALSGPQIYYDVSKKILITQKIFYAIAYLTYLINKYILNKSSMLQGGNFVVRKDALLSIGGFNTKILFWGEDTDIAKRLHQVGNVKFTFKLPIYASGRRLLREGVIKTGWRYVLNYFSVIFLNKPFHNEINISSNNLIFSKINKIHFYLEDNKLKIIFSSGLLIALIGLSYFVFSRYLNFNFDFKNKAKQFKAEIVNILKK
ncbi:MAG: glycosyltransferase family 2 protein [Minisyncoccia bacterium]